jgi:hypothetical protein
MCEPNVSVRVLSVFKLDWQLLKLSLHPSVNVKCVHVAFVH